MKHFLRFIPIGWAALLLGLGVQAQEATASGPDKWNSEGRLFLSLYGQYQAKPSKNKKMIQRLQADFGMQSMGENRKGSRDYLPVFLEYNGEDALAQAEALGFRVQTRLEGICTGLIPVDAAGAIADLEGVSRISASIAEKLHNDRSRAASKVDRVQENYIIGGLSQTYDGTGVVLGIIDIGFDYTHPTFYADPSDRSTYRVRKVWDQKATAGTKPSGYGYGAEYSGTEAILAAAHDQDQTGMHATHVAGTAGGSGAGTVYKGMAPGTDMVFVSTDMTSRGVLDGISYIEAYAAAQKKPCVVNMSLGNDIGPHDGTTALNAACDQISRKGFVMVASAGNSGDTKLHYGAGVAAGKEAETYLEMEEAEDIYIDCWSNNRKHFVVSVVVREDDRDVAYVSYPTNGNGGKQQIKYKGTLLATVDADCETSSGNRQPHVLMSLDASPAVEKGYGMMLRFRAVEDSVGIHAWISSGEFAGGDTEYTHSSSVAAGAGVLSVAAYNTRISWKNSEGKGYRYTSIGEEDGISSFSSRGPLVNGINKPDIAAPGAGVVSSGNSHNVSYVAASNLIDKTGVDGKEYPWVLTQGTSMSSPAMAGIVALFLQKDPTLDITGVKEVLSQTAVNDNYTGLSARTEPNPVWGYGKVDALAGLKYLEGGEEPVEEVTVTLAQTSGGTIEVEFEDATVVHSGDRMPKGTILWMLADAEEDYEFVSWWDGDTEELREYEVEGDVSISAVFRPKSDPDPDPEKFVVWIEKTPGGTVEVSNGHEPVSSGDSLPKGAALILRAAPDEDHRFVSWWDGSTSRLRSYVLDGNLTVSATFERERVVVYIEKTPGGTVEASHGQEPVFSGDTLPKGTALTLRAVPDDGYRFVSWWDSSTNRLRSYVLNEPRTVSATFERKVELETEQESGLRIYPNPSDGHVVLEAGIAARIEVFSPQGARLREFELGEGERYDLDLSGQPSGLYYARLSRQGRTSVFRILLR